MHVTIATAPCSWGVWYQDGKPSGTPYETFLSQAAEAGYRALELGPVGYLPTDPVLLKELMDRYGLYVCAGTACWPFERFQSFEEYKPMIDDLCTRLVRMGARDMVVMDGTGLKNLDEPKAQWSRAHWKAYNEKIGRMREYAAGEYGVRTVFHPHVGTLIEYEDEIVRLLEDTQTDLCFDTGHHAYANGDWREGARRTIDFLLKYAEKIPYLHFKNVDGRVMRRVVEEHLDEDAAFDLDVMCDLPDGIIDFRELHAALERIGFDGIGVIEQDMPRATTAQAFAAAKRNLAFLKEIGLID